MRAMPLYRLCLLLVVALCGLFFVSAISALVNPAMTSLAKRKVAWAASASGVVQSGTEAPSVAHLYLSPSGDDTRDGRSPATPIRTLARAHELISQAKPDYDITVHITPGTYTKQSVVWTYTMPEHTITFTGTESGTRPVFAYCASGADCASSTTWFRLNQWNGKNSNLIFKNLHVRDYPGQAILFYGSRGGPTLSNGNNRVEHMRFENIGKDTTAIVGSFNSKNNTIVGNEFILGPGTGGLHALYIAHYASGWVVRDNRFERISGDPIRIRDQSDNTLVEGNTFTRSGVKGMVTTWFCDKTIRSDCTKETSECPNAGTIVRFNRWDGIGYDGGSNVPLVSDERPQDGPSDCRRVPPPRIRTAGNTQIGDVQPPTVSFTSPANGATLSGAVALSATASDNVGVAAVEFRDNTTLLATDTASPFSHSWNTTAVQNGSHTLYAIARDAAGNRATSTVSVRVDNTTPPPPPPSSSQSYPLNANWNSARGTLTQSQSVWRYMEDLTQSGAHYVYTRTTSGPRSSDLVTFSAEVKPEGAATGVSLSFSNTDNASLGKATAKCTLSNAGSAVPVVAGEATRARAEVVALSGGWYRCSITAKVNTSASSQNMTFQISPFKDTGDTAAAGFQFRNARVGVIR